jgi:hypothetical protein
MNWQGWITIVCGCVFPVAFLVWLVIHIALGLPVDDDRGNLHRGFQPPEELDDE